MEGTYGMMIIFSLSDDGFGALDILWGDALLSLEKEDGRKMDVTVGLQEGGF